MEKNKQVRAEEEMKGGAPGMAGMPKRVASVMMIEVKGSGRWAKQKTNAAPLSESLRERIDERSRYNRVPTE